MPADEVLLLQTAQGLQCLVDVFYLPLWIEDRHTLVRLLYRACQSDALFLHLNALADIDTDPYQRAVGKKHVGP